MPTTHSMQLQTEITLLEYVKAEMVLLWSQNSPIQIFLNCPIQFTVHIWYKVLSFGKEIFTYKSQFSKYGFTALIKKGDKVSL